MAATLPLQAAAAIVGFPAWLGYLGVILHELEVEPQLSRRVTTAWAPQMDRLAGHGRQWLNIAARSILTLEGALS